MLNKINSILLFLLVSAPLFAQPELGLNLMRHVWQANKTNPAIVQTNTLVISLPGIRNNLTFDGPTYNQIVTKENGKPVIDIDKFIGHLKAQNSLRDDLDLPTLGLALRFGGLTLSAGHSVKYNSFFKYPKTLPQLVWQGNAQFIGETVDIANELQITGYHELAFGAAYKFGNLTLGAKGKFLNGISDATSDKDHHSATLYTNPDVYQITLAGDYILNTANSINYNSYKDLDADFNYGKLTLDRFFSGNTGFAVDLGARLEAGKWDFAASVIDIGKITWKEDVTNYAATKTIQYDGLDFSQALTGGETASFDQALDTLEQLFKVEKTSNEYSGKLPRKAYLSALYKLNETVSLGGLYFYEKYRGESTSAVAVATNVALIKAITVGGTYAIKENSYDNIGLNVAIKLGPVQIFGATDNIFAVFNPGDSRNFSARIGGSLLIK